MLMVKTCQCHLGHLVDICLYPLSGNTLLNVVHCINLYFHPGSSLKQEPWSVFIFRYRAVSMVLTWKFTSAHLWRINSSSHQELQILFAKELVYMLLRLGMLTRSHSIWCTSFFRSSIRRVMPYLKLKIEYWLGGYF